MKIKNISVKIVNIGSRIVKPDEIVELSEEVGNLPSVQALIRTNVLQDMSVPTVEDEEFNAKVLEAAKKLVEEREVEEDKPRRRGGRKSKATEEVEEEITETITEE